MRFKNGVSWYTETKATIYFPEGNIRCSLCPALETYSRNQCRLTGEYLMDTRTIGFNCPLEIITKQQEAKENETNQQL